MDIISKNLKPIKYRIVEEYEYGSDPEMPKEPIMADIPNIFHLYVTFDNDKEYKIVDYGFNLELIPIYFPQYKEKRDTYNKMNKTQVVQLLKLIFDSNDIEKVDVHTINCLEKMIELCNLNYDKDVTNLLISINAKSMRNLEKKLGNDFANELIELENEVDILENLSTLDNVVPISTNEYNKPNSTSIKNNDETSQWIEEIITTDISKKEEQDNSMSPDNIIPFKSR